MGWPLAVSAGLMERRSRALAAALWPLTVGHLLAMLVVILPFSLLVALVQWQRQIQIGASLLVIGFGIFRFVNRRHPRVLARIRPTQLGLWSFAVAIAHGAGLMLVPIYLGLCRAADLDRRDAAAGALINANLGMAVLVSLAHSVAMIAAGGFLAWLVYRYLGLKFVSRSWFNLDATWASSLIIGGHPLVCDRPGEPALSRVAVHSGSVAARPLPRRASHFYLCPTSAAGRAEVKSEYATPRAAGGSHRTPLPPSPLSGPAKPTSPAKAWASMVGPAVPTSRQVCSGLAAGGNGFELSVRRCLATAIIVLPMRFVQPEHAQRR
jgi:hypothetical protein